MTLTCAPLPSRGLLSSSLGPMLVLLISYHRRSMIALALRSSPSPAKKKSRSRDMGSARLLSASHHSANSGNGFPHPSASCQGETPPPFPTGRGSLCRTSPRHTRTACSPRGSKCQFRSSPYSSSRQGTNLSRGSTASSEEGLPSMILSSSGALAGVAPLPLNSRLELELDSADEKINRCQIQGEEC